MDDKRQYSLEEIARWMNAPADQANALAELGAPAYAMLEEFYREWAANLARESRN